jgi:hypothetical protein
LPCALRCLGARLARLGPQRRRQTPRTSHRSHHGRGLSTPPALPLQRSNGELRTANAVRAGGPHGRGLHRLPRVLQRTHWPGFDGTIAYEMCSPLEGGGSMENLDRCARQFLRYMEAIIPRTRHRSSGTAPNRTFKSILRPSRTIVRSSMSPARLRESARLIAS